MKDKFTWLFCSLGVLAFIAIIMMVAANFIHEPPPTKPWDEETKDGWTFVGRTPEGHAIKKKYFKEHGVWIFSVTTKYESISAVPVEILQRTQAGDSYK